MNVTEDRTKKQVHNKIINKNIATDIEAKAVQ